MAVNIDTSTDLGKRVQRQLETATVAWLTTVDSNRRPFPSPVWFLYEDDGTLLIYSQKNKPKVSNIANNAAVSINFDTEEDGERVTVFDGAAVLDESANPVKHHAEYLSKYHDRILRLGMTDESFSDEYSVAIRIILQKLRGW